MAMGRSSALLTTVLLVVTMGLLANGVDGASMKIVSHVPGSLRMHCKSGDNNLGPKATGNGQVVQWQFTDDFFHRTLFYCDFQWTDRSQHVDVWTADIGCTHCVWDVTPNGFYKHEDGASGNVFVCPWK